jgi:hypothetical protein
MHELRRGERLLMSDMQVGTLLKELGIKSVNDLIHTNIGKKSN